MKNIAHPSVLLTANEVQRIRQQSFYCESERQLSADLLNLIEEKRWLRIMQPKAMGGLEWAFPKVVQLFEALAWADGNLGWCVNLGAGANMFAGYLEESVSKQIFNSDRIWCAGSGAVSGRAEIVKNGYLLSGEWKYASGSAHASHFTANCFLIANGEYIFDKQKKRIFQSFIFPKELVSALDTWRVTGLKATSSHDFKLDRIFVPKESAFSLLKASSFAEGPLFRFPFEVLAVVNMAIMPIGLALHFMDLFQDLMEQKKPLNGSHLLKENTVLKEIFASVSLSFCTAREDMYALLDEAWQNVEANGFANPEILTQLVESAKEAAAQSRKLVYDLFPYCGMSVVFEPSELNKVWRDLTVASQHYILLQN